MLDCTALRDNLPREREQERHRGGSPMGFGVSPTSSFGAEAQSSASKFRKGYAFPTLAAIPPAAHPLNHRLHFPNKTFLLGREHALKYTLCSKPIYQRVCLQKAGNGQALLLRRNLRPAIEKSYAVIGRGSASCG